jgi:hypothetical protein
MVFREGSTKVPIRPVVLNKFRDLWEYEKEHKKVRTPNRKTNYCELNVEDSKLMFVEDNKNRLCILSFISAILKVA